MEAFLTVILFVFLGFWLLGVLGRWGLRRWLARKQREFAERFGNGGTGADSTNGGGSFGNGSFRGFYANFGGTKNSSRKRRREGEVTVTQTTRRSEYQVRKGVGEYVEYEEVSAQTSTTTTTYDE